MEDFVTQNAMLGLVSALLMQAWKHSGLPLMAFPQGSTDKAQERLNRLLSILVAGVIALGIHYTWHYDDHTGQFDIAFHGNAATVTGAVWEWVKQWAAQHGAYKAVVVLPEVLGDIRTLLQKQAKP